MSNLIIIKEYENRFGLTLSVVLNTAKNIYQIFNGKECFFNEFKTKEEAEKYCYLFNKKFDFCL